MGGRFRNERRDIDELIPVVGLYPRFIDVKRADIVRDFTYDAENPAALGREGIAMDHLDGRERAGRGRLAVGFLPK